MSRAALHASQTHGPAGPTLPAAVRDAAGRPGGFTFIAAREERRYSFTELARQTDRRAAQLLAAGLSRGDRVGFIITCNHEFVLSFLGALAAGVVPVPVYPPASIGQLEHYLHGTARILAEARIRAVLTDARAARVLGTLLDRVPGLERLIEVEQLRRLGADDHPAIDHDAVQLSDTAFIQFTSGSTARPRGVVVTHRSLLANLHAILKFGLQINPTDHTVSWLPMYHDMGLIGFVLAPAWYAMPATFIETLLFLKRPALWMQTMHRVRGTISFAPNFAYALATRRTPDAALEGLDLSCVKALGCAAEPNNPATLRAFVERFRPAGLRPGALFPCYGMAEATLAVSFPPLGRGLRLDRIDAEAYRTRRRAVPVEAGESVELVACGSAMRGHRITVEDEGGNELPDRRVGELVFHGPSIARGYFRNAEATRATFGDGRLRTGDVGYLDAGEVYVTGRKKDLIILHGRNYDPQGIEWEAAEVEGVRKGNVVAFSRPGPSTEELVLVLEARPSHEPTSVARAVHERLGRALALHPAEVLVLAAGQLPKTSSGKLQRSLTRAAYLAGELGARGSRAGRLELLALARHLLNSLWARLRHRSSVRIATGED